MAQADMEAQLQQYLTQHNVESLLKDIVVKLCEDKPDDVYEYIKNYITELQKKEGAADDDDEPAPVRSTTRRGAVSAAVMDPDEEFERKVVPKDAATMLALQKTVSTNILFQHLEPEELTQVLDAMFLVKNSAGDMIIKQGDEGDNFYCIHSGTVEVIVNDEKVSEISEGGSFGELALIYNQPRAASIRAKTDTQLWAIDNGTYRRILMGSTMRKRKQYEEFLANVKILNSLDKWERLAVADALEPCNFEDGTDIVKQGEPGNEFFIIIEGKAVVNKKNEAGEVSKVNELGPADYFGEIALLNKEGRAATVTASGPVKAAKMDRERFERVLGPCEDILRRNMENYKQFKPDSE
jgi:cAMP-dependent protein kinase regulator